jgi:hypothetical protein
MSRPTGAQTLHDLSIVIKLEKISLIQRAFLVPSCRYAQPQRPPRQQHAEITTGTASPAAGVKIATGFGQLGGW